LVKNITITVDEEVARWARVWAAQQNTSVSRLVGELLRQRMLEEDDYERAMRRYSRRKPGELKGSSGSYPKRHELHARSDLR
jgi:Family of unknown function (DUF6364)